MYSVIDWRFHENINKYIQLVFKQIQKRNELGLAKVAYLKANLSTALVCDQFDFLALLNLK